MIFKNWKKIYIPNDVKNIVFSVNIAKTIAFFGRGSFSQSFLIRDCRKNASMTSSSVMDISKIEQQCLAFESSGRKIALPVYSVYCNVEVHISAAFVYLKTTFVNTSSGPISGTYSFPTMVGFQPSAVVSSCDLYFPGGSFSTSVINPDEHKVETNQQLQSIDSSASSYDPSIFKMPFYGCPPQCQIVVELRYLQDLHFNDKGSYEIQIPLSLKQPGAIYNNMQTNLFASINPGSSNTIQGLQWDSNIHLQQFPNPNRVDLALSPQGYSLNEDFKLSYKVWSNQLVASCLYERPSQFCPEGAFVMFVAPSQQVVPIPRKVVFLLDHSGSMYGDSIQFAKNAVILALKSLQPQDSFGICAFDDAQTWFNMNGSATGVEKPYNAAKVYPKQGGTTFQATMSNIDAACHFVATISADGYTDILSPYQQAIELMNHQVFFYLTLSFLSFESLYFSKI